MKILKRIILIILILLIITGLSAYLYFDRKFTPEKNYLKVEYESGIIPIKWIEGNKNVLLVPIHFPKDTTTYYLQFDTGAAYTEFYSGAIQNLKGVFIKDNQAAASFYLGKTKITSNHIKIFSTEKPSKENNSIKIIGTLGADILEDRKH